MKKQVGGSAGLLALLALLFHTQYPAGHELKGGEGAGAGAAQTGGKGSEASEADTREGPWIATRAFFQRGEADFSSQSAGAKVHSPCREDLSGGGSWRLSCLISPEGAPDYGQLRTLIGLPGGSLKDYHRWSMIASVADPLHTRLPLFADRQIEAIQRSLQADHWQMAAQWLPWADSLDPSESDIEKRRTQRRLQRDQEQMPGVVVFRRFSSGAQQTPDEPLKREILLLFLIPETPTGGVAGPPFFAAMHFATAFTEPETYGNQIGLLMPSFSGSFSSLRVLVRGWNDQFPKQSCYRIGGPVYGGSVSSFELAKAFSNATGLEFRSGVAATEDYKRALCQILERYGIKDYEAAYLAEDGTAYGQMFEGPEPPRKPECRADIPRYVFPRDISHLRDVYQDEAGSASHGNNSQDSSGVNFSIKDSSRGEDSVPTFSDVQTPLSQSAAVAEIIDHFRRRRTRLVYIAATNALDTLFLARLLRREAPDTRVMTSRPDVLFVAAAAAQEPLTGTVSLSTYPMFFKGDEWATKGGRLDDHILFTDPAFEGLYNVTQALVKKIHADLPLKPMQKEVDRQRAFRQLQNGLTHPGLWLLTLGHTGYHPIDLLDEPSDKKHTRHMGWFAIEKAGPEFLSEPDFPAPPRGWLISSEVFSLFVILSAFLALRANFSSRLRSPVWLTLEGCGCGRGRLLVQPRLVAMTGAALSLSAMEWILFLPVWRSTFDGPHYAPILERILGACGFGLPLAAIVLLWLRPRARLTKRSGFYAGLTVALWLIVVVAWGWSCFFQSAPAALLFRYRALDLYSGASPALPFLVLGIVSLSGFLFYLKRFTRAGVGRPCLELDEIEKIFESLPLRRYYRKVNRQIVAPAQMSSADWLRRMLLSALAVLACVMVVHFTTYAAAFENQWYNRALACAVAMLLFSLATTCYDLLLISRNLQKLLGLVDFLPLREAFKRISRELPHRPIWSQQPPKHPIVKQMRIALDRRRQLRCESNSDADFDKAIWVIPGYGGRLRKRAAAVVAIGAPASSGEGAGTAVARALAPAAAALPGETWQTAQSYLQERCNYERLCARLTTKIVAQDLRPFWMKGIEEPTAERSDATAVHQHDTELFKCCSDFVALQFFRYLTYLVTQVRSIAWCLSFALLMLMVTLNSYSPQAPQLIGRFLAILFLGLGVIVFRIFAQMERDAVLSRIAGTKPGELNQEFWIQVCAMGILPLIGVISHLFPSIAGYLHSWVVPGVEALK